MKPASGDVYLLSGCCFGANSDGAAQQPQEQKPAAYPYPPLTSHKKTESQMGPRNHAHAVYLGVWYDCVSWSSSDYVKNVLVGGGLLTSDSLRGVWKTCRAKNAGYLLLLQTQTRLFYDLQLQLHARLHIWCGDCLSACLTLTTD